LVFALVLSTFILTSTALADEDMVYGGLSRHKAKFKIDGRKVFLREGERGPNGMQLISAEKAQAIVSIDGKVYSFMRGSSDRKLLEQTIALSRSAGNAFFVRGYINGTPSAFIVDTGASYVSMNSKEARRLKIKYKTGKKIDMSTAAKKTYAHLVTLDSVRVEGIIVNNVTAAVLPGKFPEIILLGNSFLKNLSIQQTEQKLIMMKK
jgi:aspartyl protease family protein